MAHDNTIDSTSTIINSALDLAKRNLSSAWESCEPGQNFSDPIAETFSNIQNPFSTLETSYLQTSYIKKNSNYVELKNVVFWKKISRKKWKKKRSLIENDETFQYILLTESLCQLLSNAKIGKLIIRKPNQCQKDIYYDICDGQVFRTDNFFTEHPDALQIIIYHDAVEVCNPL